MRVHSVPGYDLERPRHHYIAQVDRGEELAGLCVSATPPYRSQYDHGTLNGRYITLQAHFLSRPSFTSYILLLFDVTPFHS